VYGKDPIMCLVSIFIMEVSHDDFCAGKYKWNINVKDGKIKYFNNKENFI